MPGTGSASYVLGPLAVAAALTLLMLLARWAFGRRGSVVDNRPDHGLLEAVADARTLTELDHLRHALAAAAVRCTVARSGGRYRLLVWPEDGGRARDILSRVRRG